MFKLRATLLLLTAAHISVKSIASASSSETPSIRTYFYSGGHYTEDGSGGHVFVDQMYVERLEPVQCSRRQPYPIVFIPGQGQTGTNFLNKPDGTRSWTSHFLSRGYTVYLLDQTFRGRSPWLAGAGATQPSTFPAERIEQRFTAPEKYNLWPQAKFHTRWPGGGIIGDPTFDFFYASNVQFVLNATYQQSTVQLAGADLLDSIGKPVILVGHSQGGIMPPLIADLRSNLTKAIILLEPSGPPFEDVIFSPAPARAFGLADIPLQYDPPVLDPAADLVKQVFPTPVNNSDNSTLPCILQAGSPPPRHLPNLASLPILVVTAEASFHAPYDYCNVLYLRQAGCAHVEHIELGRVGIHGNGHMMFLEQNSDDIWRLLHRWIQRLT